MNYSPAIQSIHAALVRGEDSAAISREALARIEDAMETLGDYPGVIGEGLLALRRAVGLLKNADEFLDEDSLMLVAANVRDQWENLAPALEKLAAGYPPQAE